MAALPFVITGAILLIGLLGTLVPGLPGAPLIWLGIAIYGYMERFRHVGPVFLALSAAAVGVALLTDHAARNWKLRGASRQGRWGALLGALLGPVAMGPIGLVLGPIIVSIAWELASRRQFQPALRAGTAVLLVILGARVLSVYIGVVLVVSFALKVLGGAL